MRLVPVLLPSLISLCSAALVPTTFNPCALEPDIMQELILCGNPISPPRAQEVWAKRTEAIPGMKATDLIYEVCRINNNAGYTLWSQYMSELDPEDVPIVDRIAYDCLKQHGLVAS